MFAASKSGSADSKDAQFKNVTMLLHGNGTNGAQNNTFLDSSTNNFTITRNGNTTQGTFTPYGSNWSNYFDGATATRLTLPSNTAFAFGTGAYTVEAWVYLSSYAATQGSIFDSGNATGALDFFVISTGALGIGEYGVGNILTSSSSAVSLNAWNHVAVVRASTASNDTKLYVNGSLVATGTDTKNWTVTTTPSVGGINLSGYSTNGYISNLRVVKGSAVYTSAFTPSTTPLTAITNTSLLTCQSNRFIDNSTNNFTITRNGDVSVQRFSPFSPTTAYSTSVIGGSGYFDGTGDYLTTPTGQTPLTLGTSDFTVEMWFYGTTQAKTQPALFTSDPGSGLANTILLQFVSSTGQTVLWVNNTNLTASSTTNYIRFNQWNHIAVCRSGGSTYSLYINGVAVNNVSTNSTSLTTNSWYVGYWTVADNAFTGYITDFRILKGTALYTSAFTPPTAPLTAITNTSLLLNTTNAGILDNAMMNDLETVGNAQISTSVKKYGTGSMYFDGTGDYLATPDSPSWDFGTGDFTLEGWIYPTTSGSVRVLWSAFSDSGDNGWSFELTSADKLTFYAEGAYRVTSTGSVSANTWTHIAVCRSGSSLKLFINGTTDGSVTNTTDISGSTSRLVIGATPSGTVTYTGYIDELRITKAARYTANFTAPTAAFPDKG